MPPPGRRGSARALTYSGGKCAGKSPGRYRQQGVGPDPTPLCPAPSWRTSPHSRFCRVHVDGHRLHGRPGIPQWTSRLDQRLAVQQNCSGLNALGLSSGFGFSGGFGQVRRGHHCRRRRPRTSNLHSRTKQSSCGAQCRPSLTGTLAAHTGQRLHRAVCRGPDRNRRRPVLRPDSCRMDTS